MKEILTLKVTKISRRWHARLIEDGIVLDEHACALKQDIGFICSELLRWYDKLGGVSRMASRSRSRPKSNCMAIGKIYFHILKK